MQLSFTIDYRTSWGECVGVEVSLKKRQGKSAPRIFLMETSDGSRWTTDVGVQEKGICSFTYEYVIIRDDKIVRREWNLVTRNFNVTDDRNFVFLDFWRDIPILSHLYSSAYTHSVSHASIHGAEFVYYDKTLVFRVQAPQLLEGQQLALVGSQPPLGAWNADRAIRMNPAGLNEWAVSVSAEGLYLPFEYKYVVLDRNGQLLAWEEGDNRHSPECNTENGRVVVVYDESLHLCEKQWKVAGVVVPVFSLRSESSQGVGDFSDLRRMVDWAQKTRMHIIQLLPIYDTVQTHTWRDCYPYNSISIYALHPMYLDLSRLPEVVNASFRKKYEEKRAELNALPSVDYEAVNKLKEDYLRRLYKQEGESVLECPDFRSFMQRNDYWLPAYTTFCMLRDEYGTADFRLWPAHNVYNEQDVRSMCEKRKRETGYYAYVQYLLDKQLSETITYARERGVLLKGDIPIGISRHSVEAWSEPYYFHMNGQAGAPPDDFSKDGQNWGFPTYNWSRMAEDGYKWWVRRFRKMAEYFDAYRIDHVLGFFRIWQIPMHSVNGLLGQFVPSLPMSVEEIESYGLKFDADAYTRPYITDAVVADIFGPDAAYVRHKFLVVNADGTYSMRPEYSTQRQVLEHKSEITLPNIIDGLYKLISNVLFIPDAEVPDRYHPRISVMDESVYKALGEEHQQAFAHLYEQYYYHRHNDFWYAEAMKKLPVLIQSTQMLVCAEDLGMVPACVGPCLDGLKMLSLEIQAMPKAPGLLFANLQDNPYRSVATIFTHDMPTLRGWWEEDYGRTQRFYNQVLSHEGVAPQRMSASLCEEVVQQHLDCPSMLCLISLQDWLSIDEHVRHPHPEEERINVPANAHHYWRYRMHLTIEQLMANEELCHRIESMIMRGGRG